MSNRLDPEMLEEAVEAFDTFVDAVRASGLAEDPHFRAYHLASLEGESGGWLGGRYLVDALRDALDEAYDAESEEIDPDEALAASREAPMSS